MKRRKFTIEFKKKIAQEAIEVGSQVQVARKNELSQKTVSRWVKEYREGLLTEDSKNQPKKRKQTRKPEVSDTEAVDILEENQYLEKENDKLKNLIGEKELEIAILRDLLKKKNPHLMKNWE
ncbi:transposase [Bacillus pseudomycoides]|uniref:transposase n=1 Tax=Bacillus pseudomycoides TaxID=64104 RepID=UPI000BF082AC|nr:transposase [Bacillus pseudomycoides]PEI84687.1 transposase [Bacillus pseudomycoides]